MFVFCYCIKSTFIELGINKYVTGYICCSRNNRLGSINKEGKQQRDHPVYLPSFVYSRCIKEPQAHFCEFKFCRLEEFHLNRHIYGSSFAVTIECAPQGGSVLL